MADESTPGGYLEALNLRHERFRALGGTQDIQADMSVLNPIKDEITDLHRKIVFDLASAGLSNQDVADVMGISKERLQTLFDREVKTAYQLCHASLARSLYYMGVAGDEKAATNWLKHHNRSKWATKTQVSGTEGGEPIKTEDTGSRDVLAKLIAGMSVATNLVRKTGPAALPQVKEAAVKTVSVKAKKQIMIKKPRQDTEGT